MTTHTPQGLLWSIILALTAALGLLLFLLLRPSQTTPPKPTTPKQRIWKPHDAMRPTASIDFQDKGDVASLQTAIKHSLEYLSKLRPQTTFRFGPHLAQRARMRETLTDLQQKLKRWGLQPRLFQYIQRRYQFYQSAARQKVLFTGYYEASLKGSRTKTARFHVPLYKRPPDLLRLSLRPFSFFPRFPGLPKSIRVRLTHTHKLLPYYTRAQIDFQGALANKGLELLWIDDPIDVFFLHIQGSGIVSLDSGERVRVNYADKNGHAYKPIGRWMLQKAMLRRGGISMQSIRAYLKKYPQRQKSIFSYNPSYVFFREVKRGPLGNLGVPVTAYRSIATDRFLIPKAALCLVKTTLPTFSSQGQPNGVRTWTRLVLNQDTGGAIRSPHRVDLFTGFGRQSEQIAGHLKSRGTFYCLLKKP